MHKTALNQSLQAKYKRCLDVFQTINTFKNVTYQKMFFFCFLNFTKNAINKLNCINRSATYKSTNVSVFKCSYLINLLIKLKKMCFPDLRLLGSTPRVHVRWFLWIHDDVYRNGSWKSIHHLCNLLVRNTMFVPSEEKWM